VTDPRLEKLAQVLVRYSTNVKPGDVVSIGGDPVGEPLAMALYREVLAAGGHPWMRLLPEECEEWLLKLGSKEQIAHTSGFDKYIMSQVNVRIGIWAENNSRSLTSADSRKQALHSKARKPIMDIFFKRAAQPATAPDRLRWVGTGYPTYGSAQDAEMSLNEYADFVFRAGKLHQRDPVGAWKKLGVAQQRLADFLDKVRELRFRTPQGTDLRVGVKGRRWINCQGHENFPDGEVFTGPIENATEGVVTYQPPAVYGGREVTDIRLVFKAGRCMECSASKNEDYLVKMLDQDKGARVLGEIAIGTNYDITQHTRNTLFDEKIGGTFHAALGAAYPESGGKNTSGLHWDMVCDLRRGGTIEADGKVISRNGKFLNAAWPK
jgi:aminopeptidase